MYFIIYFIESQCRDDTEKNYKSNKWNICFQHLETIKWSKKLKISFVFHIN